MTHAGRQRVCGIVTNERPNVVRTERDALRAILVGPRARTAKHYLTSERTCSAASHGSQPSTPREAKSSTANSPRSPRTTGRESWTSGPKPRPESDRHLPLHQSISRRPSVRTPRLPREEPASPPARTSARRQRRTCIARTAGQGRADSGVVDRHPATNTLVANAGSLGPLARARPSRWCRPSVSTAGRTRSSLVSCLQEQLDRGPASMRFGRDHAQRVIQRARVRRVDH